jgi:predicted nucleotidyltransferase
MKKFKGTDITYAELTAWILGMYKKYRVTEIRYFGSRASGSPREDSDIDVYITFSKRSPSGRPIYTELFVKDGRKYQVEFHAFMDLGDGFVATYLVGDSPNELIS